MGLVRRHVLYCATLGTLNANDNTNPKDAETEIPGSIQNKSRSSHACLISSETQN